MRFELHFHSSLAEKPGKSATRASVSPAVIVIMMLGEAIVGVEWAEHFKVPVRHWCIVPNIRISANDTSPFLPDSLCTCCSTWHEVDTQEIFVEIFKHLSMALFREDVLKLGPLQKLCGRTEEALKRVKAPRRYNLWDEAETSMMLKITTALKF